MSAILQMSAAEIARQIRQQQITPTQAVADHITRIEHVNPLINAVVTPMFEQARAEATEKTQFIADNGTDNLSPLFGVPITIKDCFPVKDVRFTGGSWYLRDNIADEDAPPVRKLRDAGAIILGKTNLPDMCWSGDSVNPVFGRTNNPHNRHHTAGGSSGGEGAIIAAGGSPLGLGSDIAGSVRVPAAMNGCVSLKPTGGRIPPEGHLPMATGKIKDWNTAGPMARRIEDLALALEVLSETPTKNYQELEIAGRRCVVYIHNPITPVRKSLTETVSAAAGALQHAGMDVVRDDSLPLPFALATYFHLMKKHGNQAFKDGLGNGKEPQLLPELARHLIGRGRISLPALAFTYGVDVGGGMVNLLGANSFEALDDCKTDVLEAMGEGGVLLTLVMTAPAPRHYLTFQSGLIAPYTMMFNAMKLPAVVVPLRYNQKGLPLAVQIVARPYEDEVALAVASELERVFGGWRMATL